MQGQPQEPTMRAATLIATLTCLLLVPARADAQRITGRATDETARAPIPEVQVEALSQGRVIAHTMTDATGAYALQLPGAARVVIRATRLGYSAYTSDAIDLAANAAVTRNIAMKPAAIEADSIVVRADGSFERGTDAFRRRCALGLGVCLGPGALMQRNAVRVTDLFRGVEGLALRGGPTDPVIATMQGYGCLAIFLDHHVYPIAMYDRTRSLTGSIISGNPALGNAQSARGAGLNVIDPATITGIEIYRGFHEVPKELLRTQRAQEIWPSKSGPCGVAIVWTRTSW
jgi:hypothetical protein